MQSTTPNPSTYSPKYFNTQPSVKISKTKEERLAYVDAIARRSPGPIYQEPRPSVKAAVFSSAKRELSAVSGNSTSFYLSHGNPSTRRGFRFSDEVRGHRTMNDTPGPSTYLVKSERPSRNYSAIRASGHKDLFSKSYAEFTAQTPGVGTYSPSPQPTRRNLYTIPRSRRQLEPKMSEV